MIACLEWESVFLLFGLRDIGLQIMPGWVMLGLTYMSTRGLSADELYLNEVTQHVRRAATRRMSLALIGG